MQVMGILNCTPDSFYDGGLGDLIGRGREMVRQGADWIDVGGESTRPGSDPVSLDEEMRRVIPVIRALRDCPLSIDTMKWQVAAAALEAGARMINDVTGLAHPSMQRLAADSGVPCVVMHMQGRPKTMQHSPHYPAGVVAEVRQWCQRRVDTLLAAGLRSSQLILDPGIGFGKTAEQNAQLICNLHTFRDLGFPVLIGASRKSHLGKILGLGPPDLLSATLAVHTMALTGGASIVRVHDVAEHRQMVDVVRFYRRSESQCTGLYPFSKSPSSRFCSTTF